MAKYGSKVTKAWKVVGKDEHGRLSQLSRRYHSQSAANEFAELARKSGVQGVEIRTVMGYDKIQNG